MNQIIETQNLTRFFGRQEVVRNLTFEVPTGSIYAFLGPNGAGKTTTIKMLMNILQPSGGSARIMGVDSKDLGPTQLAQIGYVSENQELPEWMTVRQFIDYCSPMYPTWDQAFCNKLLKDFDLPLDKKLSSLSRGTKVKASLVTSLAYLNYPAKMMTCDTNCRQRSLRLSAKLNPKISMHQTSPALGQS